MCRKESAVPARDAWIAKVDMPAFKADMDALGKKLRAEEGAADKTHLSHMVDLCDLLLVVGLAGLGLPSATVFPWACLGLAITIRWTAIAHHVSHGGYVRCGDARYHRGTFAVGGWVARARDWLDWMLPEAWDVEHNSLHHYCTNEAEDPDLVQRNFVRTRGWTTYPRWFVYFVCAASALTWKWVYYAVNTWKHLRLETERRNGKKFSRATIERAEYPILLHQMWEESELMQPLVFLARVMLPYIAFRLVLPTVTFYYLLGWEACFNCMCNLALAELWANIHSFAIVVPNHAGDDMYMYQSHVKPNTASFYLRQVIGSVDFHTGSDPKNSALYNNFIDAMQGWLNYQIEHHCFPNLSMVSYRKAQPLVKEICERHGVPYVQMPMWTRVAKTLRIMAGDESMREFPAELEIKEDLCDTRMYQY